MVHGDPIPGRVPEAAQQQPILMRFGGEIPSGLRKANERFLATYFQTVAENDGQAQLVGMTTVVPTEKGKHTFWKKPPQSLTVFTFAATDADEVAQKSAYNRTPEQWQHEMAVQYLRLVQQGGGLRKNLAVPASQPEHGEQHLTRVKGLAFKDGDTETRALLIERRLPGDHIFDRVVVIPHHKEEDARKVVEAMNSYVAEGMGEGKTITDTALADILAEQGKEDWTKKKRNFSLDALKALYHAARRVGKKRSS